MTKLQYQALNHELRAAYRKAYQDCIDHARQYDQYAQTSYDIIQQNNAIAQAIVAMRSSPDGKLRYIWLNKTAYLRRESILYPLI